MSARNFRHRFCEALKDLDIILTAEPANRLKATPCAAHARLATTDLACKLADCVAWDAYAAGSSFSSSAVAGAEVYQVALAVGPENFRSASELGCENGMLSIATHLTPVAVAQERPTCSEGLRRQLWSVHSPSPLQKAAAVAAERVEVQLPAETPPIILDSRSERNVS